MTDVILISTLLTIFKAMLGGAAIFLLLRLRDKMVGINFKSVIGGIKDDPTAAAIYYGLSVLGACILFGWILS